MAQERFVEPGRAIGFFHQLEERLLTPRFGVPAINYPDY